VLASVLYGVLAMILPDVVCTTVGIFYDEHLLAIASINGNVEEVVNSDDISHVMCFMIV